MTANDKEDDNVSPPKIPISQIDEGHVRDDITKELYMPLCSTIVLKLNKEILYVPPDFKNGLTKDDLVDSGAYASTIAQSEFDRLKQQAPPISAKSTTLLLLKLKSQIELEKPIATPTLKFDLGDITFAEHFVVLRNLIKPILGFHFMRDNSVVIGTTHGLIHFPHWTMQAKNYAGEAAAKPQLVLIHYSITVPPMTTKTIKAFDA